MLFSCCKKNNSIINANVNMENISRIFVSTKQILTTGMFFYEELPDKSIQFITLSGDKIDNFRQWIDYISNNKLKDIYLAYENNSEYLIMVGEKTIGWNFSEEDNRILLKEENINIQKKNNPSCITELKQAFKSNTKYLTILDNDNYDVISAEEKNSIIYLSASGIYHTKGINSFYSLMQLQNNITENVKLNYIDSVNFVLNYYDLYFMNNSKLIIKYPASEDHVQSAIIAWQNMTGLPKFNLPNFIIEEVLRAENRFIYLDPKTFDYENRIGEPFCGKINNQPCFFLMTSELSCDRLVNGSEELKKCITALSDEDFKRFLLLCQYHNGLSVMIDPPLQAIQMPMENIFKQVFQNQSSASVLYPANCEPNNNFPLGRYYQKTKDELKK